MAKTAIEAQHSDDFMTYCNAAGGEVTEILNKDKAPLTDRRTTRQIRRSALSYIRAETEPNREKDLNGRRDGGDGGGDGSAKAVQCSDSDISPLG